MEKGYVRYSYIIDKKTALYAIPKSVASQLDGVYNTIEEADGFLYLAQPAEQLIRFKDGAEVRFAKLPDEQSFITFFPLDLLLGRRRKVMGVMDEVARRLRGGGSQVNCFQRGCRKPALFYVDAPQGLTEGGCWYACSREHFSPVTSKGVPVQEGDYRRMMKLG